MLAIGAAMLGAAHVLGVDCDAGALAVAAENCGTFDGIAVSLTVRLSVCFHQRAAQCMEESSKALVLLLHAQLHLRCWGAAVSAGDRACAAPNLPLQIPGVS